MMDRIHWELYRRREAGLGERAARGYLAQGRRLSPRRPAPGRGEEHGR